MYSSSSSSAAPRRSSSESNNRAKSSTYDINDSLQELTILLETLTERLLENENMTEDSLNEMKNQVLKLSKEISVLSSDNSNINAIITEISNRQLHNFTTTTISDRLTEVKALAKRKFPKQIDGTNSENYKKLKTLFEQKLNSNNNNDEEDLFMTDKLTDADFKCPYSATNFIEPMKKFVALTLCNIYSILCITFF